MSERLEAAEFLRELSEKILFWDAESQAIGEAQKERLQQIADLVESHDERVTSLLTYNNTMLDENRAQRRKIKQLETRIDALVHKIYGVDGIIPLTLAEHETLVSAVRLNHEQQQGASDYAGSALEKANLDGLDLA